MKLLAWNFVCLGILLFIVINAVLSVPTVFQQFAFDQPCVAVLYFPFVWLPGMLVLLVYFSHQVIIRRLLKGARAIIPFILADRMQQDASVLAHIS